MKNIFLIAFVAALPALTFAQGTGNISNNIHQNNLNLDGVLIGNDKKMELVGTVFLADQWTNAIVKLGNNQVYKAVLVKYNLLDDVLYFQGENGAEMKFVQPVKEFSLLTADSELKNAKVFKSGYPDIEKYNKSSFYQVIAEGKVSLLKKVSKRIVQQREYNSAVTTNEVITVTKFFLFQEGKLTEVKKDKSSFTSLLEKKEEVKNFITTNKVDFKNEDHLARLISYYNGL